MPTDLASSLHKCNMKLPGVSMFMASYLKSASFWLAFRSSFSNSYSSLLLIPPVKLSMSLPDRRQIQPFLRQWMLSLTFLLLGAMLKMNLVCHFFVTRYPMGSQYQMWLVAVYTIIFFVEGVVGFKMHDYGNKYIIVPERTIFAGSVTKELKVRSRILNSIQNFTGSQCSSKSVGVIWWNLGTLQTSRAAAFWTICNLLIW